MRGRKKIVAISGSTRLHSTNLGLINAIIDLFSENYDFRIFRGLSDLPHFNPDLDTDNVPQAVSDFRNLLRSADGILICTPEYAMGVPGTLKNAIDWTVSSMEFSHKPVALITASSDGKRAHRSLLETLRIIESDIPESSQLLIPFVKTKIKGDKITDTDTFGLVKDLIKSLAGTIDKNSDANKSI
ncbi:MAG TPA: NAD(P)H-dependent oxidoreductase [Chitinophagaceae bacterium]|nr:NAD(P)H-dependent oxidoreductase [Chitinophagaceae bacterium]